MLIRQVLNSDCRSLTAGGARVYQYTAGKMVISINKNTRSPVNPGVNKQAAKPIADVTNGKKLAQL